MPDLTYRKFFLFLLPPLIFLMISCDRADKTNDGSVDNSAARLVAFAEGNGYVTLVETINDLQEIKSDFSVQNEAVKVRLRITNVSQETRRLEYVGPKVSVFKGPSGEHPSGEDLIWTTDTLISTQPIFEKVLMPMEELLLVVDIHPTHAQLERGTYRLAAKVKANPSHPLPPEPPMLEFEIK